MKSMLIKHIFMKIKDNYKRFLSLLSMALLGVGFYAGIQACSPDMLETLDDFYDKNNVFDIEIVSNLGLTDNDVKALSNINNIDKIIGIYSKDEYLNTINEQYVIRLIGLSNNINNVYLEEGRLPKNNNEIVVEKALLKDNNIKINDNIIINNVNYKIVGAVLSPLYFSTEKPATTLGSGKIDYYAYTLDGNIKSDVYTNIYITVSNAKDELTNNNKYKSLIENVKNDIDKIKESREMLHLIQDYVAKVIGTPRTAIVQIESGNRKVSTDELVIFCKLYGFSPCSVHEYSQRNSFIVFPMALYSNRL